MTLDHGIITYLQREDSPTFSTDDGHQFDNLPPRTIIRAVLNPTPGSNIHIEIWLPDPENWNGRFLGIGNGGAAGIIRYRTLPGPLSGGYAVATTDLGTAPAPDAGIDNSEVWKDFGFRATHLMTLLAKQVIREFYGRDPEYSYFNGGSTGGQQALQEAQRYPDDYDGIVAGIPAHCRTPLHAYFLWNYQILQECPFTESQEANVIAAGTEYRASSEPPVAAGQFVTDPRCDAEDIEAVIAIALEKDPTLTPKHADALRKLFDGPKHTETGERIFNGIPFGSAFGPAHGNLYLFEWVFGKKRPLTDINFGSDIDTYTAALGPYLNAENADLSAFAKCGGKLIIDSGTADSVVPYHATLDYYERVIEACGSLEKAQEFCRLYLVPGMSHGGGPGMNWPPDFMGAMIRWVEQGQAPEALVGRRGVDGKVVFEMTLYPYPAQAHWDSKSASYQPVIEPRGGVERIAERFRPAAAE